MLKLKKEDFFNVALLISMIILSIFMLEIGEFIDKCYIYISIASILLLLYQLFMLMRRKIGIISILSIFFILSYVFNFGNFYLKLFSKEEFYIFFSDWFAYDVEMKAKVGLFTLCLLQSLFTGMCFFLSKGDRYRLSDYKRFYDISDDVKRNAIHKTGVILFLISFPCRMYWDIQQIMMSQVGNSYVGGYSAAGVIDDIGIWFAPAMICLMYSKKDKKGYCRVIMLFYIIYSVVVMVMSGARRAYITSLLGMFVFYYDYVHSKKNRKHNIIPFVFLALGIIIILNFLTIIRNERHTSLSFSRMIMNNVSNLFSLDFIWNTFGEFGITGMPTYYAFKYFPAQHPFYFGKNFLMSIVFILPIGWLFHYTFATTALINQIRRNGFFRNAGLGSSIICELFCDFGWASLMVGILAGYYIGKLGCTNNKDTAAINIKTLTRYCMGISIIGYTRGSTSEIIRSGAYTLIGIYALCSIMISYYKKYEIRNMNF